MAATGTECQAVNIATLSITQSYVFYSIIRSVVLPVLSQRLTEDRCIVRTKGKSKAVSFAEPSTKSAVKLGYTSLTAAPADPNICLIDDICTALHSISKFNQCVGYLEDDGEGNYRHEIYLKNEQLRQEMEVESLNHILQAPDQRRSLMSLSRRNRLYIAVTLASSVLQLDGTSWLSRRWRSKDILFLPLEGHDAMTRRIDFSNPYISWQKVSRNHAVESRAESDATITPRYIRHEYLFALGCTLIELSLNHRLCDLRRPDDMEPTEVLTDLNTAMRLIDAVYEESGTKWGDVVYKCLTYPFNLRDPRNLTVDNEEFQEAVYNDVLTPLRQDLENFDSMGRIK